MVVAIDVDVVVALTVASSLPVRAACVPASDVAVEDEGASTNVHGIHCSTDVAFVVLLMLLSLRLLSVGFSPPASSSRTRSVNFCANSDGNEVDGASAADDDSEDWADAEVESDSLVSVDARLSK